MKKLLLFTFIIILSSFGEITAWGKIGHRTVGEIAERHLKPEVKEKVYELLDGESLASVSTWADEIRSNPEFDKYSTWHYVNLPLDKDYDDVSHIGPNVVKMINTAIPILESPMAEKSVKQFWLKYLVHMVGDVHQPLHTGREEDWGGNKIDVYFKGRKDAESLTNLHDLWDAGLIDDFKMSHSDLSTHLINKYGSMPVEQRKAKDWANESHQFVPKIYETKEGSYLSYDYVYENFPIVEQRLYEAGIRLANLLNNIFSEQVN